jgi:ankyrin repeat protein
LIFIKWVDIKDLDDLNWKYIWSTKLHSNVEVLQMSKTNNIARCIELIKEGCDINARDLDGNTPLHLAAQMGYSKLLGILLFHEATIDSINRK